ncbi:hypothetical protein LCGC14_2632780 [marine sediment metagenome]|uniref:Uncharacterized protein n=1 Tax=marine sediment metagenome TaxID=412755 RepID=A0A0F9CAU0_9ZZZZ
MKKTITIRKRITDLFSNLFRNKADDINALDTTFVPPHKKEPEWRSKTRAKWIDSHNQQQMRESKKLHKRRAKNKVARKSRKINFRKAA